MQTANANTPIVITARNAAVTEDQKAYVRRKIEGLHLDYPRIIEAKAILDVRGRQQYAEIILFCADHITVEAETEAKTMTEAIDETISNIARRMRKFKTRLLKRHRPKNHPIRELEERVLAVSVVEPQLTSEEEDHGDLIDHIVHKEQFRLRTLHADEAIMDLEMSERPFLVYTDADNDEISIVYRRKDGDYGLIEPCRGQAKA